MKIKEISFNRDQSKVISKNYNEKAYHSVIHSSSLVDSNLSLNRLMNKRLKYYSQCHKESIETIDSAQLQSLKEEFIKFDDNNMKGFMKIKSVTKREAINLITKKYQNFSKSKWQNIPKPQNLSQYQNIYPSESFTKIVLSNNNHKNNQNIDPQTSVSIQSEKQDQKSPCETSQQKPLNITTLTPINSKNSTKPFKSSLLVSNYLSQKINLPYNKNNPHLKQRLQARKVSPKTKTHSIIVPQQRLSRHRFTKSSISRIGFNPQNDQKQTDNFLSIDLITPSKSIVRPSTCENFSKRAKNQFHSTPKAKTSKRYIKIDTPTKDESINPYTKKRYLHVLLEIEKKTNEKNLKNHAKSRSLQCVFFSNNLENNLFMSKLQILESAFLRQAGLQIRFIKINS